MKKLILYLFFAVVIFNSKVKSQTGLYDFGFEYNFSTIVLNSNNDTLDLAWWGGLNAIHMAEIDINLDGINDILLFDRIGNKIMPLINLNVPGKFSYKYAPEYRRFFPQDLSDWIILYDYNNDGKKDIFTYFPGGIRLFKNTSTNNQLSFSLVTNMINSLHFNSYINIFLTNVDMPIITDVDGDGDVDIVVFFVLGNYIELHQNMGVELHGNPDTLDFKRTQRCFGNIQESDLTNQIFLNINCPFSNKISENNRNSKAVNHVGSTMLFFDTDGDGLKDLLMGDTDYPSITWLKNGGTPDTAHFVAQDTLFPSNTRPIKLFSMPVLSYLDLNNNGVKDLVASPFDASPIISESKKSVWLYENHGRNDSIDLLFVKENFIQDRMIEHGSGAYPVLFDYNGNGLLDLFVANYGTRDTSYYFEGVLKSEFISTIALYENIGNINEPKFKLLTEDFANLSQYKLLSVYPTFGDLTGNGVPDMILGNKNGKIWFFTNTAQLGNPMNLVLTDSNYQNIDVGDYSTPFLFDLDKDNKLDLIIGERLGNLHYYKNIGTSSSPSFSLITNNLGNVNTADLNYSWHGHSVPYFYRNNNGKTWLFTGSNRGWVLNYRNIDNNLSGAFELIDTLFVVYDFNKFKIMEGLKSAPAVADLNNDGHPELILGNLGGGLNFFIGTESPADTVGIERFYAADFSINIFPNPTNDFLKIDISHFMINSKVYIYDVLGKLINIYDVKFGETNIIDVSEFNSGFYIVKYQGVNGGQTVTKHKTFVKL